jgi:methylenetetrahydrofolate reductase (NADPH)
LIPLRIRELYRQRKPVVSFEVFPPKKDSGLNSVLSALEELSGLRPDFISVTYGAGGGAQSAKTLEIASHLKNAHGTEPLAHLTCVGASRESIRATAAALREAGIENIMALRGDLPEGSALSGDFAHATDLIRELKYGGDFCVGGACYPEGHLECDDFYRDLVYLREKQDAGADFLVTQLFFDNDLFYRFLEDVKKVGVSIPISAGIMPIFSRSQIERMIFMCGVSLPSAIIRLLYKYERDPESLKKAGIAYAVDQMERLIRGGADGVHLYTMNRPETAVEAMARCRELGIRR